MASVSGEAIMRSACLFIQVIIFLYQLFVVYETALHHGHVFFDSIKKWIYAGIALLFILIVLPDDYQLIVFQGTLLLCMLQKRYRHLIVTNVIMLVTACTTILSTIALSQAGIISIQMIYFICMIISFIIQLLYLLRCDEDCNQTYGFPIMIMVLCFALLLLLNAHRVNETMFLLYGILYLTMVSAYRIMYCLERRSIDEQNALKLQYERIGNQDRYATIQKENEYIMRSLHDMKKQLALFQDIDHDELSKYKEELKKRTEMIILDQKSGDPLLDQVLPLYHAKFLEHHIQFQLECDTIAYDFMDQIDLCALLCNLLDNAYQSCLQCEEPFILCKMQKVNHQIVWKFKNSVNVNYQKKQLFGHGFGLSNIKTIAQMYGGDFTYEVDQIHGVFTSIVYLDMNR